MSTILVTGASSGIGKITAGLLLERGHTVYAAARRMEAMDDLGRKGAIILGLDITKEAEIQAAVRRITADHGGVDVLVNNAGFGLYGAVEDCPLDDARYQFEVNLFGMARLTQALLPAMRSNKAGRIINVSSMGGRIYTPLGAWYHATKHAVEGWSDCLRIELAQFGLRVVIIEPGLIDTGFAKVAIDRLLARSGGGPYGPMARAIANAKAPMSPPLVIARTIAKAVAARHPKTRYVAGKLARPLMFIRTVLGDRIFDRLIMSQITIR